MKNVSAAAPIPSRTGACHGHCRIWWSLWSPETRASMNGHRVNAPKTIVGMTMEGPKTLGIVTPNRVGSQLGPIRSSPSSQPRYQSGWAGELTAEETNGP